VLPFLFVAVDCLAYLTLLLFIPISVFLGVGVAQLFFFNGFLTTHLMWERKGKKKERKKLGF